MSYDVKCMWCNSCCSYFDLSMDDEEEVCPFCKEDDVEIA